MGRPPITYGIWTSMVQAAGSVEALAEVVAISRQNLSPVLTGMRNLPGPSRKLAEAFAAERGITARLYIHPRVRGSYLISAADGWWILSPGQGWNERTPSTRSNEEDWSHLGSIELPFVHLTEILRPGGILTS
jgi:hypothetical protein